MAVLLVALSRLGHNGTTVAFSAFPYVLRQKLWLFAFQRERTESETTKKAQHVEQTNREGRRQESRAKGKGKGGKGKHWKGTEPAAQKGIRAKTGTKNGTFYQCFVNEAARSCFHSAKAGDL